jgi:hypothetical protein
VEQADWITWTNNLHQYSDMYIDQLPTLHTIHFFSSSGPVSSQSSRVIQRSAKVSKLAKTAAPMKAANWRSGAAWTWQKRFANRQCLANLFGLYPVTQFRILGNSLANKFCFSPVYTRLGSSPYQEKIRERRTWDIRSISNVTCKNWRENLLSFSTGKPRLRRKNPTVKFGALAGYLSPSLPTFLSYFRAFFDRSRASLFSTPWETDLNQV